MCVCFRINVRKKFRIKNLHTLPTKPTVRRPLMLGADIFVGMRRQCVVQMSGNLYFLFSAEHFSLSNIFPYILFQIIFVSKM